MGKTLRSMSLLKIVGEKLPPSQRSRLEIDEPVPETPIGFKVMMYDYEYIHAHDHAHAKVLILHSFKRTYFSLTDLTIRGRSIARLPSSSACQAAPPGSRTLTTWVLIQRNLRLIIHTGHTMASQNRLMGTYKQAIQSMQTRCVFWSHCVCC